MNNEEKARASVEQAKLIGKETWIDRLSPEAWSWLTAFIVAAISLDFVEIVYFAFVRPDPLWFVIHIFCAGILLRLCRRLLAVPR